MSDSSMNPDLADDLAVVDSQSDGSAAVDNLPEVLRPPTKAMPFPTQLLLGLANLGVWISIFATYQVLIPRQLTLLDPVNYTGLLALITFLGGISAILANPLSGALSDRTTSRWGRRKPWIVVGAVLAALSLLLMALSNNIFLLATGLILFQFFINMDIATLAAIVPDKVPVSQRATVSAFVGVTVPLGALIGIILVSQVVRTTETAFYVLIAVLLVLITVFVFVIREDRLPKGAIPAPNFRKFLAGFWISPVKYPDFALTLIGRILVMSGYYTTTGFLYLYLQDAVGYQNLFPGQTPDQGLAIYQLLTTAVLFIAIFVTGIISDKLQQRKLFVIGSSLLIAIALGILAFFPTWEAVLIAAVIMGIGFGAFLSVDLALQTQVLPKDSDRGKDLGILNTANLFPQIFVPIFATVAVFQFHSYLFFYLAGAVAAVIGAALILFIRSVR